MEYGSMEYGSIVVWEYRSMGVYEYGIWEYTSMRDSEMEYSRYVGACEYASM